MMFRASSINIANDRMLQMRNGENVRVTLTALQTLAAVVDTGSFAAASRELGYTPSAVSQQIAKLEQTLDLRLFDRAGRSIHATEAALYLRARSAELVGLLSQVERDAGRLAAGQAGRIRIGSFRSADAQLLSRSVAQFLVRRRGVEVDLHEGEPWDLLPQVVSGDIDVAIAFRYEVASPPWSSDVQVIPLLREPLTVIGSPSHRLASHASVELYELEHEAWAGNDTSTLAHACLMNTTAKAGFRPDIAFHSNNFDALFGLVRNKLAVAMVPGLTLAGRTDVARLNVTDLPYREVAAVVRMGRPDPLAQAAIDALSSVARELAEENGWELLADG